MLSNMKGEYFDSVFLLSAIVVWVLSAFVLLPVAAIILNETAAGEQSIGYVSSAVSFLSAAAAGWAAAGKRKKGSLYTALLTAVVIITALLTVGFLIDGTKLEPSAVMSVISFTFAGCMVGAVLLYRPGRGRKSRKNLLRNRNFT